MLRPITQTKLTDASTVFKKRVRGKQRLDKLCGATGTPDPKAKTTKQNTREFSSSLHQGKKDGNKGPAREDAHYSIQ